MVDNNIIKYTKHGFVDFTQLVHCKQGINWSKSIGLKIPFKYDEVFGEFTIIDIDRKKDHIFVLYNNKKYEIPRQSIVKNELLNFIHPERLEFKYKENDILELQNGKLKILAKGRNNNTNERYYKTECLICGYIKESPEYSLMQGFGCSVCANTLVVPYLNDFEIKFPQYAKYLVNEEDKHLSSSSLKKVSCICPKCKSTYKEILYNISKQGFKCPFCEKSYSFPERFVYNLLLQLNISFEHQKVFNWSKKCKEHPIKIYDFYIEDMNCIIEVHGGQHYQHENICFSKESNRTFEDEVKNDLFKENLAKKNGILNYIIIDARKSNINWMMDSIKNNKNFCEIFDISSVDWSNIFEVNNYNFYKKICEMWNNKKSITEISKELNLERHYISELLNLSCSLEDTNYNENESIARGRTLTGKKNSKPIICLDTNQCFSSIALCEKLSEEVFGCRLTNNNMTRQIRKHKRHKGFLFSYLDKTTYEQILKESPELIYGDSFNF